ncbi:MAG TPA: cation diffusion facilitator family transporter [Methanospirillum sp.]|uniref:cation diffusion facilitator family transporter n=3 Tax=Methanospirillum sp. TaxID=45200 RepID=UPI002C04A7F5|nr:cation diffusion facilitator family transporter [Methanospirillum sp.]HOJ96542.1 cation diffusion facilitator family transporter [Methanospirillum sp.]
MTPSSQNPNTEKENTAILSVGSNSALVLMKLIVGFALGSVSMISEAIHSGMDLLASIIAFLSVRKSGQAPDDEHTFGHGKFESISGMIEALLIFIAAILIIEEAIAKIIDPASEPMNQTLMIAGIMVMGISVGVNALVSARLMKIAKKTESIALESDAWHLRTDVYTSLGVMTGLILIWATKIAILDSLIAIGVAFVILKAAYDLTKKSYKDLIDYRLTDEEVSRITSIICEHQSVYVNFHGLRTRRAGPEIFIDLHLVVDKDISVEQSHDITDHLEKDLKIEYPRANVTIHVEPNTGEHIKKPPLCDLAR